MNGNIDRGQTSENKNELDNLADQDKEDQGSLATRELRNVSYFILFFAAVFVVNAMETGSYRTPWPVAIIVSLVGIGLYGYSLMKGKEERA